MSRLSIKGEVGMNLISWPTYIRRYNPHRWESHDGVLPIRYTIVPTLNADGFHFVGDFTEYSLPKKPKEIAKDLVRDWYSYQVMVPEEDKMLFVYYVHRGSQITTMPLSVMVYGRTLNWNRKTESIQETDDDY